MSKQVKKQAIAAEFKDFEEVYTAQSIYREKTTQKHGHRYLIKYRDYPRALSCWAVPINGNVLIMSECVTYESFETYILTRRKNIREDIKNDWIFWTYGCFYP